MSPSSQCLYVRADAVHATKKQAPPIRTFHFPVTYLTQEQLSHFERRKLFSPSHPPFGTKRGW